MASEGRPAGTFGPRLVSFCRRLRALGLPIGLGEELDLANATSHIEALDRQDFRLACMVTLVKRPEDLARFEATFEEYWGSAGGGATPPPTSSAEAPPAPPPRYPGVLPLPWGSPGEVTKATAATPWIFRYSPEAPPRGGGIPALPHRQLEPMRRLARRFRRHMATLQGRRHRSGRRGQVDFPRTFRASLRSGGEVLALRRRRRRLQRARLVILWDVSGSMEDHAPLLFALVHALLRAIPSARAFAFSTDVEPLSALLRGRGYREALATASPRLAQAKGGTRIGRCLAEFHRRHGHLIDRRTTVMVMSDGWDLGDLDLLRGEMAELHRRSQTLMWVNPYCDGPGFVPAVAGMRAAQPYVDILIPPGALVERSTYEVYFGRTIGRPEGRFHRGSPGALS